MAVEIEHYRLVTNILSDILNANRADSGLPEPTRNDYSEGCHKGFAKQNHFLLGLGGYLKLSLEKTNKVLSAAGIEHTAPGPTISCNMEIRLRIRSVDGPGATMPMAHADNGPGRKRDAKQKPVKFCQRFLPCGAYRYRSNDRGANNTGHSRPIVGYANDDLEGHGLARISPDGVENVA